MYVSSNELILTIANDGECYKQFIEACKQRFFGGKWAVISIIAHAKLQLNNLSVHPITYEVGAMRDARIYLDNRYFSHFLTEIAPEYIKSAQKQLEMWEKTCKNT